jgi:hypothetical protein
VFSIAAAMFLRVAGTSPMNFYLISGNISIFIVCIVIGLVKSGHHHLIIEMQLVLAMIKKWLAWRLKKTSIHSHKYLIYQF